MDASQTSCMPLPKNIKKQTQKISKDDFSTSPVIQVLFSYYIEPLIFILGTVQSYSKNTE